MMVYQWPKHIVIVKTVNVMVELNKQVHRLFMFEQGAEEDIWT
jgi:hypothetical protein